MLQKYKNRMGVMLGFLVLSFCFVASSAQAFVLIPASAEVEGDEHNHGNASNSSQGVFEPRQFRAAPTFVRKQNPKTVYNLAGSYVSAPPPAMNYFFSSTNDMYVANSLSYKENVTQFYYYSRWQIVVGEKMR